MDFKPKKPRVEIQNELFDKYPHDLQMYIDHPDARITLNEFQDFAIERLKGNCIYFCFVNSVEKCSSNLFIRSSTYVGDGYTER